MGLHGGHRQVRIQENSDAVQTVAGEAKRFPGGQMSFGQQEQIKGVLRIFALKDPPEMNKIIIKLIFQTKMADFMFM